MKKVTAALVALMFLGSVSFAQTTDKKADAPKTKTEKKAEKKAEKAEKKKMDKKTDAKAAPAK
ncbi:hypothetical protein F0919_16650 [Taibaiella lutea]|uniref:Acid-shock protein n=1 Tax=Taibaiella lutea TaxID=2608001 RepID=A0A5M6CB50_9BACT|nr:hypothetical protein [Taibaiella lutea]KAA5532418.1 hypothetical protein F0919_16650 [Taibaiella lutea]